MAASGGDGRRAVPGSIGGAMDPRTVQLRWLEAVRLTRRRVLSWSARAASAAGVAGIIAGLERSPARGGEPLHPARAAARRLLAAVRIWGCQYQNLDLDALRASDLDLLVVEPLLSSAPVRALDAAEVARLKVRPDGGRRLVLAYLSVGEASDVRPYWRDEWLSRPPQWLGRANPQWPGAHGVRYWHPAWQALVLGEEPVALGSLIAVGFDGVFLDRVDAYSTWQNERPTAADDMVHLVANVATTARGIRPDFLIVAQNAEPLLARADYRAVIDAVSKESLLTGLGGPEQANAEADVAWSRAGLEAAREAGLVVLAIEYLADPDKIAAVRRRLTAWGYVPFFAERLLDRLPGSRPVRRE